MAPERQYPFYRSRKTISVRRGIGYCDPDGDQTTRNGDFPFVKNPIP